MRLITPILICAASLGVWLSAARAGEAADLFDKPLKVERIPLPNETHNPQARPLLSCFHYGAVTVKQVDRGEKGAAQLSMLPPDSAGGPRDCTEANAPGETVIDGGEWSGYFKGVRAGYVFFDADDGWNGGVGFAVFAAGDGRPIFQDVENGIHGIGVMEAGLVLRYRRVHGAPCSLHAGGAACWRTVKDATGLTGDAPDCDAAYEADIAQAGAGADAAAANPTIVEYEAETVLGTAPPATRPLDGKVECRPAI